ncbi:MAG: hypothetical protein SF066_22475 [Thermoanaerobaculia bacterium]|nr:hypothetical protein [Thermoanaerobaculia bacterium]
MPQVLAPSRLCRIVLVLTLSLTASLPASPAQAAEPRSLDWRPLQRLVAFWLGNQFDASPPPETLPVGPEEGSDLDQGGASMDPAGSGTGGPRGGTTGGSGTGG